MDGLHPCSPLPRSRRGCRPARPARSVTARHRYTWSPVYQNKNAGSRYLVFSSRTNRTAARLILPFSGKGKGRARSFKSLRRRFSASEFSGKPGIDRIWGIRRFPALNGPVPGRSDPGHGAAGAPVPWSAPARRSFCPAHHPGRPFRPGSSGSSVCGTACHAR